MEPDVRTAMESRFGHDFSRVRVHDDSAADGVAAARDGLAFSVGEHIGFRSGHYRPRAPYGRWVLSHELAHVVQQRNGGGGEPARAHGDALESEAHAAADAVTAGRAASVRAGGRDSTMVSLLTPTQFRTQLGATPEQAVAIDALFANPTFRGIFDWIGACTAPPPRDHGPINLRVTPHLTIRGVERFGGYSPFSRTLEINPVKPEHVDNPTELVDTITHEVIHAADDVRGPCTTAGSPPPPMGAAATTTEDISRANAIATGNEARLNVALGPSASDPCNEFMDINAAAQSTITTILTENVQAARVGRPTVTFVNMIIRGNAAARAAYETCRSAACGLPTASARTAGLAACSRDVIGRFMPPSLLAGLLPAVLYFDTNSTAIRAADTEKLDLVTLFLTTHAATTVRLVGHADQRGSVTYNLDLGQRRAEAVRTALVARGVPAAQIISVTSEGETSPRATGASTQWRDRTVDILP